MEKQGKVRYAEVCVCVCSVAQSCLTLCDPMDYSPPDFYVQGIFPARLLEWVTISSPGGGHGNPLQYSWLENPMGKGAWEVTVHGVTKSRTWLSSARTQMHTHTHTHKWPRCLTSLVTRKIQIKIIMKYHFIPTRMCVCVCVYMWDVQSCLTLCDPIDYSLSDSSVSGIF